MRETRVQCPTCDGHGTISLWQALEERGDSPTFMADQEYLDDLVHAAGGPSIYLRCLKDGRRCPTANADPAEIRLRNQRYQDAGLGHWPLCCRGDDE